MILFADILDVIDAGAEVAPILVIVAGTLGKSTCEITISNSTCRVTISNSTCEITISNSTCRVTISNST